MDWTAVGSVGALIVSGAGTVLVYRRGSKGDQALSLSQDADRRSKETETNLKTQTDIIDNLQEEVGRYRVELNAKADELGRKHAELEEARETIKSMREDLGEAVAGVSAANVIIKSLERTVETLQTEVVSLRRLVQDHERTIALHERTINEFRAQGMQEIS